MSDAYANGARISSNSWGGSSSYYTSDSQTYDRLVRDAQSGVSDNQEMTIVFAAGNDGSTSGSVTEPATAKNVITVGASENVNPFGGADGSGITDSQANSAMDIVSFSSRGPTHDGRIKPDIMAPGTHVSGGCAPGEPREPDVEHGHGLGPELFPLERGWRVGWSQQQQVLPHVPAVVHRLFRHEATPLLPWPEPARWCGSTSSTSPGRPPARP